MPRVLKASEVVFMDPFDVATRAASSAMVHRDEVEAAFAAGLREGQQGALSALPELLDALNAAVDDVQRGWTRQTTDDRRALVDVAGELAQWMVGRELERDPMLAVAQVDDAVHAVAPTGDVTVFVAPELVDILEQKWHPSQGAHVEGDATLLKGEMRVIAGVTNADLRWADALTRVHEALDVVDGE